MSLISRLIAARGAGDQDNSVPNGREGAGSRGSPGRVRHLQGFVRQGQPDERLVAPWSGAHRRIGAPEGGTARNGAAGDHRHPRGGTGGRRRRRRRRDSDSCVPVSSDRSAGGRRAHRSSGQYQEGAVAGAGRHAVPGAEGQGSGCRGSVRDREGHRFRIRSLDRGHAELRHHERDVRVSGPVRRHALRAAAGRWYGRGLERRRAPDGANMLPLDRLEGLLESLLAVREARDRCAAP